MKSNFYEKLYSSEDKNKKILMDKMSKLLDESISECIDLRQRQINENKTKIENDSDNKPIKNIIMDNIHHLYDYNHRNSRAEARRSCTNSKYRFKRIKGKCRKYSYFI